MSGRELLRSYRNPRWCGSKQDPHDAPNLSGAALSELEKLPGEEIKGELLALLAEARLPGELRDAFLRMQRDGVLEAILPELAACAGISQNEYHRFDVLTHTLHAADAASPARPLLRFALLLHDIGKPATRTVEPDGRVRFIGHEAVGAEMAEKICERLGFSPEERTWIVAAVANHMRLQQVDEMSDRALAGIQRKLPPDLTLYDLLEIRQADKAGSGIPEKALGAADVARIRERIDRVLSRPEPAPKSTLAINGHDLVSHLELEPSETVGRLLAHLREATLKTPEMNTPERLLELAREQLADPKFRGR